MIESSAPPMPLPWRLRRHLQTTHREWWQKADPALVDEIIETVTEMLTERRHDL